MDRDKTMQIAIGAGAIGCVLTYLGSSWMNDADEELKKVTVDDVGTKFVPAEDEESSWYSFLFNDNNEDNEDKEENENVKLEIKSKEEVKPKEEVQLAISEIKKRDKIGGETSKFWSESYNDNKEKTVNKE